MSDYILRWDPLPDLKREKRELLAIIEGVIDSGHFILGQEGAALEREFAGFLGAGHGIGVGNGTDALVHALGALGVKAGDEVITTSFSAVPTLAAILLTGAEPVFADIDPDTFLMQTKGLRDLVSRRTKAIVPVHLFGNVVDIEQVREEVGSAIPILEDCAQSHGATRRGKMSGTLGNVSAFSFYPSKNLGAIGDGGFVATNDAALAEKVRLSRYYGFINKDEAATLGGNTRLDELQAAVLRFRLKSLAANNETRRALAENYFSLLPKAFRPQSVPSAVSSVHHVFCGRVSSRRDELVRFMEDKGVQTNVYYRRPLCDQGAFQKSFSRRYEVPECRKVCQSIIALPFYPSIPKENIAKVCETMRRFYEE